MVEKWSSQDETLAGMAGEGDRKAFEELFNRYKKPVLNFIYRLIGNKETAEEVAQEVFVKVYNNLDTFDPGRPFAPWLYTIARNLAKNALRDRKYFRDISLDKTVYGKEKAIRLKDMIADPNARPDEAAEDEELSREAQKVLDSLPLAYREVIALCSIQGLTYKEAGRVLNCSAAMVGIRLKKAKILFMEKLGIDARRQGSD